MVVCKFFMEGYCRFGNQCRYEHPYGTNYPNKESDHNRPLGTSVLKASMTPSSLQLQSMQHVFQNPQQNEPSVSQRCNIHDLMQVISKDILQAEKGNQWQLSCYSPAKDLNNIPDLSDYSPEELRWECYMAIQNGRLPVCQAIVQQLYANAARVNNKLKKKDTAYSIIERWLREGDTEQSQHSVSMVGSMTSNAQISSNTQPSAEMTFSFSLPAQTNNAEFQQQQQVASFTHQPAPSSIQQPFVMGFQQQFKSGSIFGTSQINMEPSVDNTAYSLAEELSEIEHEAFRGRFVFGCIPTKPPTRELCG